KLQIVLKYKKGEQMKKLTIILLITISFIVMNCSKKGDDLDFKTLTAEEIEQVKETVKNTPIEPVEENEYAIIETKFGKMTVEFYTEVAPNHCANFKRLANAGYLSGTTFHRVIPGFVIQGGDINSRDDNKANDGMGGPGYTVDAEFNKIHHEKGILSMARAQDPNSAGSQFFICAGDVGQLDNQYTVFGKVVDGLDIIDSIVNVPRNGRDNPDESVYMKVKMVKK
ncbi:MAG: peptidylprolyl isomerase, partial [Candidatus Marinimicrobia bacterium]|nr:peptidylprolyl isomerase [Candidatus Neomarinimicrobiota bacterium]